MKFQMILLMLVFFGMLFPFSLNVENLDLDVTRSSGVTEIKSGNSHNTSGIPGEPAIPLITQFVELPDNKQLGNIQILPVSIKTQSLSNPVKAIPQNLPLSDHYINNPDIKPELDTQRCREIFNNDWIYHVSTEKLGSKNIAIISLYSLKFDVDSNTLIIPESFDLDLNLVNESQPESFQHNYTTQLIGKSIGLDFRNDYDPGYLVIYPESFQEEVDELVYWRFLQGLDVYQIAVESISSQYAGADLQEKIRNCIIDFYQMYNISHVTLIGDVDQLPARALYAFDCSFGAYDDENDIPADIYYAGLNGTWDDNGNGVYGEDDDGGDFLPEVFVGRIPADSPEELQHYISRLIPYEKGLFSNLNKAAGFSMELWTGSQSYQCQQFIYDMFFPDDYQIDFIYHDENTTDNAYAIINENRNIIQHTGHAGKTILSLENGYIRNENLNNLANDWGGLFYSIGCWSAALDYDSVGENLVTWPDHGFLGYVGNSRYGWGAPAAPGFGFSEFYQKEFMRLIFEENITSLAELNAIHKLPFVPYWNGTSVYKWCGYELNALGDSYFNILLYDSKDFDYQLNVQDDMIMLNVSENGYPISDMVVTCGIDQQQTDAWGSALIDVQNESEIYCYKKGYLFKTIALDSADPTPFVANITDIDPGGYQQGSERVFSFDLINPTEVQKDVLIQFDYSSDFLYIQPEIEALNLPANDSVDDIQCAFGIKSISESQQLQDGFVIPATIKIIDEDNGELLSHHSIVFKINAPILDIKSFRYNTMDLHYPDGNEFQCCIFNDGDITLYGLDIQFEADSIVFDDDRITHSGLLMPGDSLIVYNAWSSTTPIDIENISLKISTQLFQQSYIFEQNYSVSTGDIALEESFEEPVDWVAAPAWQSVSYYSFEGDMSLSCRPSKPGSYDIEIPSITYLNDSFISFQYRYKMPMYGKDGVYLILDTDSQSDTLLFLGAGGALLSNTREDAQVYIESDWAEYRLNIADNSSIDLDAGEQMNLWLRFIYSETIDGFNQYDSMDYMGVFIDQLRLGEDWSDFEQPYPEEVSVIVYPNPNADFHWVNVKVLLDESQSATLQVFNIRGQRIRALKHINLNAGENLILWDKKDEFDRNVETGIYLLKLKIGNESYYRKVLILN